jgi:3D (Asp-Asp-Asp) domain-containing protein
VLKPKLLVALSLLPSLCAFAADRKHKQPTGRQQKEKFVAFAYTGSGNLTAEGRPPVAGKLIAADPKVLPMGTLVKVSDAGPWSGEYRVGDVGGKIKGNKIDVFVPTLAEAREFGRRQVTITILERPLRAATTGTRARKADSAGCSGCGGNGSKAMMRKGEARQSSVYTARGSVPAGKAGIRSERSHSGEGGGNPTFARLSALPRTSAY